MRWVYLILALAIFIMIASIATIALSADLAIKPRLSVVMKKEKGPAPKYVPPEGAVEIGRHVLPPEKE